MIYCHFIFVAACLFITPAISAQERNQNADGNLPKIDELLDRATEQIATLQPDTTQAYLYRRLAALFARSQDLDAAYNALKTIRIAKSDFGQTAKNLRRVGFLEMVEEAAFYQGTQTAIKIVAECPDEYRGYSDDAFGHIALKAAELQDAKGAWMSIAKIKTTDGLYYYELSAAITLDDKIRGKKCLLEWHQKMFIRGECQIIGEEWYSVPWLLSLYQWCELNDEYNQLLDHACQLSSNPEKARAELVAQPSDGATADMSESEQNTKKTRVSAAQIRSTIASIRKLKSPRQKAERLLKAANELLEFDRSSTSSKEH